MQPGDPPLLEHHQPNGGSSSSLPVRLLVGVVLITCLAFVVVDSLTSKHIEHASLNFLGWVEHHPFLGVLAVVLVYILATILFVPGSILTVGAGYAFGAACHSTAKGVALASTAVFCGASIGSVCSFLLGRYLFRDCVVRLASSYPLFRAVDRALQGNGLKIMILLRLSPLIPYNALDYMSGITSISLFAYTLALIGILPGTILFCFLGATASSLTDSTSSKHEVVRVISLVFGLVFAIIGVAVASYYSKVELSKILEPDDRSELSDMIDNSEPAENSPMSEADGNIMLTYETSGQMSA